jgi:hypothetical protein
MSSRFSVCVELPSYGKCAPGKSSQAEACWPDSACELRTSLGTPSPRPESSPRHPCGARGPPAPGRAPTPPRTSVRRPRWSISQTNKTHFINHFQTPPSPPRSGCRSASPTLKSGYLAHARATSF